MIRVAPIIVALTGCQVGYQVRPPEGTDKDSSEADTADDTRADTGAPDTGAPGACNATVDPTQDGVPLQLEPDGSEVLAALQFGTALRPASVDGEPRVWLQAGTAGCLEWADEPERCGVYLLDEADWARPVLPTSAEPRFQLDETGEFTLSLAGVTALGGPTGEGLVFVQQAADSGLWSWRVFGTAPDAPTPVTEAPLAIIGMVTPALPTAADLDGDGESDLVVPVSGDSPGLRMFLAPTAGQWGPDDADFTVTVTTGTGHVSDLAFADLDGDGYEDAVYVDDGTSGHPLRARLGPLPGGDTWDEADVTWEPTPDADELGESAPDGLVDDRDGLQRVADVTGDGRDDVLVRTQAGPDSSREELVSYLVTGATPGVRSIADEIELAAPPDPERTGPLGYAGAADVDGDGAPDLLLHPFTTEGPDWLGLLFLGPVEAGDAAVQLTAPASDGVEAPQLGAVGDLDGDGRASWIFVDRTEERNPRRAWLVEGCGDRAP